MTTDYLLRGIEPPPAAAPKKAGPQAGVLAIAAAAFHCLGLILAALVWHNEQSAAAPAVGLMVLVLGGMLYGIGMLVADGAARARTSYVFWSVDVWLLAFLPLSLLYNLRSGARGPAPYPLYDGFPGGYLLFWAVYLVLCVTVDLLLARRYKKRSNTAIIR